MRGIVSFLVALLLAAQVYAAPLVNSFISFPSGGSIPLPSASLDFDGTNNTYIDYELPYYSNPKKVAIAVSLYPTDVSNSKQIFLDGDTLVRIMTGGNIRVDTRDSTNDYDYIWTNNTPLSVTSQWYSIYLVIDTTQATASDRIKLYVNGTLQTSFSTATYPQQNRDLYDNTNRTSWGGSSEFVGYMFQPTIFTDSLPSVSEVVDGSAGKLYALGGFDGAISLMDASTPIYDAIQDANWRNVNGNVDVIASTP
ncbi:MAG: LamG domain-containing protein [Rickettsiales bacterium]|nr:LamG domain-containing protein [Rickettsiales bacterium]